MIRCFPPRVLQKNPSALSSVVCSLWVPHPTLFYTYSHFLTHPPMPCHFLKSWLRIPLLANVSHCPISLTLVQAAASCYPTPINKIWEQTEKFNLIPLGLGSIYDDDVHWDDDDSMVRPQHAIRADSLAAKTVYFTLKKQLFKSL